MSCLWTCPPKPGGARKHPSPRSNGTQRRFLRHLRGGRSPKSPPPSLSFPSVERPHRHRPRYGAERLVHGHSVRRRWPSTWRCPCSLMTLLVGKSGVYLINPDQKPCVFPSRRSKSEANSEPSSERALSLQPPDPTSRTFLNQKIEAPKLHSKSGLVAYVLGFRVQGFEASSLDSKPSKPCSPKP